MMNICTSLSIKSGTSWSRWQFCSPRPFGSFPAAKQDWELGWTWAMLKCRPTSVVCQTSWKLGESWDNVDFDAFRSWLDPQESRDKWGPATVHGLLHEECESIKLDTFPQCVTKQVAVCDCRMQTGWLCGLVVSLGLLLCNQGPDLGRLVPRELELSDRGVTKIQGITRIPVLGGWWLVGDVV